MGRRRLRVITIAAFLLCLTKDTLCQDENDFYYTPVERSFAQVQPPLYPSNRPSSYFEHGDSYRAQPSVASPSQQPLYNEGHVRFPSPNYNQNPSPFQLPTGRSQAGSQYYVNQPEFTVSQRQRFRPSLPHSYQLVHPASTKRPDISQIHSVAYQNDPSKPEAFLGQVTINNPDIDYLQSSRFKNIQFDGNSLKSSGSNHHGVSNDDDIDNDNQDLFEHHRVTTYNPNKLNKQRLIKPNPGRFSHYESAQLDEKLNFRNTPSKLLTGNVKTSKPAGSPEDISSYHDSSTEYKSMLDIEPLLEDDISDISSFRELMKSNQGSFDVQVIKSNNSDETEKFDSNPSASSMNTDNAPKTALTGKVQKLNPSKTQSSTPGAVSKITTTTERIVPVHEDSAENYQHDNKHVSSSNEEPDVENSNEEDDTEYVEYYDDPDTTPAPHVTQKAPQATHKTSTEHADEYEDYDITEAINHSTEKSKSNSTETFDVLLMQHNNSMVKDDNFKQFVDTTVIDQVDHVPSNDFNEGNTDISVSDEGITSAETPTVSNEDVTSVDTPSILGQEVVSVVTTKSVVNGTISVPEFSMTPSSKILATSESPAEKEENDTSVPVTTENWVVVASVQTSRSVSGARFLPFPTVEQEEKKQVLTDEKDEDDSEIEVTKNPMDGSKESTSQESTSLSTENLNDKLDSIQSELSSAVLSGALDSDDKNFEIITESTTKEPTTTTTAAIKVFTVKSTTIPVTTERSAPDPLPVLIKKFTPRPSTTSTSTTPKRPSSTSTSTTPKPKKKLVTVMDDLTGLLPAGYKPRPSYKDKRLSTTTTTTTTTSTTTEMPAVSSEEEDNINSTQGRSIGNNLKNKVIILDDKSPLVPNFKPKIRDDIFKKIQVDDFSKLLPPGYKPPESDSSESKETKKPDSIIDKVQKVDISAFLPKDFKLSTTITEKSLIPAKAVPVDISAFLPPGFKLNKTENDSKANPLGNIKIADVSNLLPPGFKLNKTDEPVPTTTTKPQSNGFKLVFPSRTGTKAVRKTTPKPLFESGPSPVTPKIQKGWPTRASTEFTGWPSPSTTPFSIEKLLEAQRNATATSPMPELSTNAATRRPTTTTTTTTPAPPPPTTPGICKKDCDIAATIKIVAGVKWIPELLDHHTKEWKNLAKEVKQELNSVYSKSDLLNKWYKGVRIDGFSQGSVLVDYFIELNDVQDRVDTLELKRLFHNSLHQARPGSVVEKVVDETEEFDPDAMQGDQPDEERLSKSDEKMTKIIDKSAGKLEMGKFVMDPAYTEFIVLPKREEPLMVEPEEESFLPQWGIAVIVIALASLLFVVIFGVTVLVNRQKSAKAKQPIPLSDDMFRELDKNHMGGIDDFHQMKERDLPYHSGKRMSTAFIEQLAYQNPGDSWRSEWTPQLQKHMQHYTPDSGRGSQIYGAAGNIYGYSGSQIYGQTGGGGSQIYGYTGEYPRSHYSRRRSEYDNNF